MRVMVVGGGGREHAIIKKLKESKEITKLYDSIDSLRVVISSDEDADVLKLFRKAIDTQTDVAFTKENTTQGHFKRGV